MPRAIWKGSISFGLVQIPVGLFTAEESDELHFTMLDRRDLSPVGYERVNKKTGKSVPWGDVVKGYEYEHGEYVVLQKEDFTRAAPEATQTIDIVDFVEAEAIDPMYFDRPYYLAPQKPGMKGYALLREALVKSKKVGIAKVVIRTKQRLAALIPHGDVLLLEVLRYPHEIRSTKDLDLPAEGKKAVDPREVDMALRLVEGMSGDFEPKKYKDEYYDALMDVIEKKAKSGQTEAIDAPKASKEKGSSGRDLMALLKKSLGEGPTQKRTKSVPAKRAAKTAKRRKKAA